MSVVRCRSLYGALSLTRTPPKRKGDSDVRQRRATATCDSEGARKRRRGQDPRRRTSTTTSTVHGVHMLTSPVHHAYPLPLDPGGPKDDISRCELRFALYS